MAFIRTKDLDPSNLILALLFTGQFLALAFRHFLDFTGFYLLVFSFALFYTLSRSIVRRRFVLFPVDFFWFGYFLLHLLSAGLLGVTDFFDFIKNFFLSAVFPFVIGRSFKFTPNITQINSCLILVLLPYIGVLLYFYLLDPSLFIADRFYPFIDRSSLSSGGDPTQIYLGFGLGAIILSNYCLIRSNSCLRANRLLFSCISFLCIYLMFLVGSRATLIALFFCVIYDQLSTHLTTKKLIFTLCLSASLPLLAYLFLSSERISFWTDLSFPFLANTGPSLCLDSSFNSVLYRISAINESIKLFSFNPFIGVGTGNYGWFYCGTKGDFVYPHNILAQILSENGLIGITIFSLCIYGIFRLYSKLTRRSDCLYRNVFANYIFVLWLFSLIVSVFSGNAYSDILLYLLSGLIVNVCVRVHSSYSGYALPTSISPLRVEHTSHLS